MNKPTHFASSPTDFASSPSDAATDAAADGAFGGKHQSPQQSRRAGYTDPLGWALKIARQGGTLAAGEGLLLVKHYEALVEAAYLEGWHNGFAHERKSVLPFVRPESEDAWEKSDACREMGER